MTNAFDATNYPTIEPENLYAGDRWVWKRTDLTDYGSGYTLSYELTLDTGADPVTITASLSGTEYLIEVSQATTANYTAGNYHWVALITRDSDSERIKIDAGTLTVKPDPATSAADPRSDARTAYDAIQAVLLNRATKDQMSYSIAGRTLERTPIPDLLVLKTHYKREVMAEEKAERLAKGLRTGSQIRVRMA